MYLKKRKNAGTAAAFKIKTNVSVGLESDLSLNKPKNPL
jgi:hypothetical protein